MPQWTFQSPRNEQRAAAIAATLLEQDFDILCLEKVFDSASREILEAALAARFPYRYGPANSGFSYKIGSGVWVLSRDPLTDHREIQFRKSRSIECFSRKGAVLLRGACGERHFWLIATHLQGEEGTSLTSNQDVRDQQMQQVREELIDPFVPPEAPLLLCGDFGTPRFNDDLLTETKSYGKMLATFAASSDSSVRLTLDDSVDNGLADNYTGRRNELDYILVRARAGELMTERTRHVFRREGWDCSSTPRSDLSYRYAVSAKVTFAS